MKAIASRQKELIDSLIAADLVGDLSASALEKDIHVTDALHALSKLQHDRIAIVFCGGTSLSKAHGLIERMSEDVDLKLVLDPAHDFSGGQLRRHLGKLKRIVIDRMEALGFRTVEQELIARNGNRYFASGWKYRTLYGADNSLRAHLSLEFTLRTPYFVTHRMPIGYLIDKLAGRGGNLVSMTCVAVEETLAEKILSFLRRHAEHRDGVRADWDIALVRHIYDTYCIVSANAQSAQRAALHFGRLVEYDIAEFSKHTAFRDNPKQCLAHALMVAEHEGQTRAEYEQVLRPLIYGTTRPSFAKAFDVFKSTASLLLETL
ncbi:MAG: nucleotidyl transferase AbiEii/AbiGii toxin family protein [Janthinobacterium lividum]